VDYEYGGYITCFDREGNITDRTKYIWFQGRQLWMFSALYNRLQKKQKWFSMAKRGHDFIVKHAYAGNGRWNYQLNRTGNVEKGTISVFTDHFVLSGLCEYAVACGDDRDLELIRETYNVMEKNIYNLDFKDIFHSTWNPILKRHGIYMISLHVAQLVSLVIGDEITRPLIDHCLEEILYVFAKDEYELLFESVSRDGKIVDNYPEGRLINPGHILESMWFCIEEGKIRQDLSIINRALQIIDWAISKGYDHEYGGIVSFLDFSGKEPPQTDWHKETDTLWHDKVWWVHSEALYALALAAIETKKKRYMDRFLNLHNWCQKYFYDSEFGEWFSSLYRDRRPKDTDKGSLWKAAYHLPRALLLIMKLFEGYVSQ
jgi:N-acylglucosamine 2-epimerase